LQEVRDWCLAILGFIGELQPGSSAVVSFERAVNEAFERGTARGLAIVARDLAEWARVLPGPAPQRLDEQLRLQFRRGLDFDVSATHRAIGRVRRKGRVSTEAEYRLLLARAEEIHSSQSSGPELDELNHLLAEYHKKDRK
jgi:hypothetical protein